MLAGVYLGEIALGQLGEHGVAPDFYPKFGWLDHTTLATFDQDTLGLLDRKTIGRLKEIN